jgi:hypothetical protein
VKSAAESYSRHFTASYLNNDAKELPKDASRTTAHFPAAR